MGELYKALQERDLPLAFRNYQVLRGRGVFSTSNPKHAAPRARQDTFMLLRQLVQLFHKTRLEMLRELSSSSQIFRSTRLERQIEKQELQRQQVLQDIRQVLRMDLTTAFSSQAEERGYLTVLDRRLALVDAIAESRAKIASSFAKGAETSSTDNRREALKVLEDWAVASPEPKKVFALSEEGSKHDTNTTKKAFSTITTLEQDLAQSLTKLMRLLVHSHTFLIRSMLDTIPEKFGIQTTVRMHVALLRYYAMFGRDGYRDSMAIITQMDRNPQLDWKKDPEVYDYLMYTLSHIPGNEPKAERLIQQMLSQDLVPRETTMKAAILCAARSGDLSTCSRYISRMQQQWNLSLSERMKAILLYACAQRGDFESALEILDQLSGSGKLVQDKDIKNSLSSQSKRRRRAQEKKTAELLPKPARPTVEESSFEGEEVSITATGNTPFVTAEMEASLSAHDIINNSNILLALINQTHARRRRLSKENSSRRLPQTTSQDFLKEEVSKVLELFTVIAKDPQQVDTQLYTIMMQYLSTLPSPLPGMMYLYREMQASERAKPNAITYRIMLDACAEQIDMEQGRALWEQMEKDKIPTLGFVRASYVKGWGRAGYLQTADWIARQGLVMQRVAQEEKEQLYWKLKSDQRQRLGRRERALFTSSSSTAHGTADRDAKLSQLQVPEMINLSVLHELMRANRVHNRPKRVINLFKQVDAGKWGEKLRPNQFTLSIVLQACSSPMADPRCVDQAVHLVEKFLRKLKDRLEPRKRRHSPVNQTPLLSLSTPSSMPLPWDPSNNSLGLDSFLTSERTRSSFLEPQGPTKTENDTLSPAASPSTSSSSSFTKSAWSSWSSWSFRSERIGEDDKEIEDDTEENISSQDGYDAIDVGDDDNMDEDSAEQMPTTMGSESYSDRLAAGGVIPCLSGENYEIYFTMLAQHHRQEKMVEVWDGMMAAYASMGLTNSSPKTLVDYDFSSISSKHEHRYKGPPRVQAVNILVEALENVQWGVQPIRRIQRDLETFWPEQDWSRAGRMRRLTGNVNRYGSVATILEEVTEPHLSLDSPSTPVQELEGNSSPSISARPPPYSGRFDDYEEYEDDDDDGFLGDGAGGRFWK
ncbi:hypothetical protein BGZ83_007313 [Gryganskiella cystojenkinii]|nr:hypothetical protein BGZ83_007313 [Gryganskiella cystojenkinii]